MELDIVNIEFYLKIHRELDFEDFEFYVELNFVKIEFQNMSILPINTLKIIVFCHIVLKLKVFIHFVQVFF